MWNYAKYPAACTMQSFQTAQLTFTCSKLSIETLEKGVKRSKLTIKTPGRRQWRRSGFYFTPSVKLLVFLLLNLNK